MAQAITRGREIDFESQFWEMNGEKFGIWKVGRTGVQYTMSHDEF